MVVCVILIGLLMWFSGICVVRVLSRFCCWVVFGLVRLTRFGVCVGLGFSVLKWILWFLLMLRIQLCMNDCMVVFDVLQMLKVGVLVDVVVELVRIMEVFLFRMGSRVCMVNRVFLMLWLKVLLNCFLVIVFSGSMELLLVLMNSMFICLCLFLMWLIRCCRLLSLVEFICMVMVCGLMEVVVVLSFVL